jgi:hypothetical protein
MTNETPGRPETSVVSVFKTSDAGLLPLAELALESAGIEYFVRNAGKADSMQWTMSQDPTTRPIVVEIVVGSDAASRAREILADLESPVAAPDQSPADLTTQDPPTVTLEDAGGAPIGTISESQLQELSAHLEETAPHEYRVTPHDFDRLRHAGADADLIRLLRRASESHGGDLVIRWVVR